MFCVFFREDLNFWIEENKNLSKHRNDNIEMDDASTVKETLNGIKAQQNKVVEALTHEQQSLEEELRKGKTTETFKQYHLFHRVFHT